MLHENDRPDCVESGRADHVERRGAIPPVALSPGCAGTGDHDGGGRRVQSGHCPRTRDFAPDGTIVARTLLGPAPARSGEGCAATGTETATFARQNTEDCRSHLADQAAERHAVEYSPYGGSATRESIGRSTNLGATPSEAAFGGHVQVEPRQAFCGETLRCGRLVPESPRPSLGALRGRKKPDSSFGSDATRTSSEAGAMRHVHSRLRSARNHDFVCRALHAGRPGHWPVHDTASTSRAY